MDGGLWTTVIHLIVFRLLLVYLERAQLVLGVLCFQCTTVFGIAAQGQACLRAALRVSVHVNMSTELPLLTSWHLRGIDDSSMPRTLHRVRLIIGGARQRPRVPYYLESENLSKMPGHALRLPRAVITS